MGRDLTDDERDAAEKYYRGLTPEQKTAYRWQHPELFSGRDATPRRAAAARSGIDYDPAERAEPSPQSLANLVPHPRGQGGPGGIPRSKKRLTEEIRRELDADPTLGRRLMHAGIVAALKGDFNFWKYIFERIDGKIEVDDKTPAPPVILKVPPGARLRADAGDDPADGSATG